MSTQFSDPCREDSLEVTQAAMDALKKTRGWVKFLGIVSIVMACFAALMLLIGAVALATKGLAGVVMVIEAAVILAAAVLYAIYWLGYSTSLKRLDDSGASIDEALDEALVRQHRLWMYQGILLVVVIVLAVAAAILLPLLAGL